MEGNYWLSTLPISFLTVISGFKFSSGFSCIVHPIIPSCVFRKADSWSDYCSKFSTFPLHPSQSPCPLSSLELLLPSLHGRHPGAFLFVSCFLTFRFCNKTFPRKCHFWEYQLLELYDLRHLRAGSFSISSYCLLWDRLSLCRLGWLRTYWDPPASASLSVGIKVCATTPGFFSISSDQHVSHR